MVQGDSQFEEFRDHVRPTVSALHELARAVVDVPERHMRLPSEASRAMRELQAEALTYGRSDIWESPVSDTHAFGGVALFSVVDLTRTFASSLLADPTPVYGHLVVARAVFEAAGVAAWLNEPAVEVDERVRRGLAEHIYNAWELDRLAIEDDTEDRIYRWEGVASRFSWDVKNNRGKPIVGGSGRPSVGDGIDRLVGTVGRRLGKAQWSYLSSVTHGTFYGLRQSITSASNETPFDPPLAEFRTVLTDVWPQTLCVSKALREAAHRRFVLFGWTDEEWTTARQEAFRQEVTLLRLLRHHRKVESTAADALH